MIDKKTEVQTLQHSVPRLASLSARPRAALFGGWLLLLYLLPFLYAPFGYASELKGTTQKSAQYHLENSTRAPATGACRKGWELGPWVKGIKERKEMASISEELDARYQGVVNYLSSIPITTTEAEFSKNIPFAMSKSGDTKSPYLYWDASAPGEPSFEVNVLYQNGCILSVFLNINRREGATEPPMIVYSRSRRSKAADTL